MRSRSKWFIQTDVDLGSGTYVDDGWMRTTTFPATVEFDMSPEQVDIYRSLLDDAEQRIVMTLKTPAFKLGQKAGEGMATGLVNKKQSEQRLVIQSRPGQERTDVFIEQFDPETGDVQFRFQIDQKIIKSLSVNSGFDHRIGQPRLGSYRAPSIELELECDIITTVKS